MIETFGIIFVSGCLLLWRKVKKGKTQNIHKNLVRTV
jgi:hypothetical protein